MGLAAPKLRPGERVDFYDDAGNAPHIREGRVFDLAPKSARMRSRCFSDGPEQTGSWWWVIPDTRARWDTDHAVRVRWDGQTGRLVRDHSPMLVRSRYDFRRDAVLSVEGARAQIRPSGLPARRDPIRARATLCAECQRALLTSDFAALHDRWSGERVVRSRGDES